MRVILEGSPSEITELINSLERRGYTVTTYPYYKTTPTWWTEVTCTSGKPYEQETSSTCTINK